MLISSESAADARLRGDEVFQFAVRDLNARIDLALAQPIQDDVLPNVVAKLRERNAVGFEPLPQRLHTTARLTLRCARAPH